MPNIVLSAAREGLLLWFNNVMPALLPFMIITNMFIGLGYAKKLGKFLAPIMSKFFGLPGEGGIAFIIGLTSGYPIGAKAVAQLRKKNMITTEHAQHLLAFCNNAGPLFILGVVGVGMFGSTTVGYILWIGHVLAALVLGMLKSNQASESMHFSACDEDTVNMSFAKTLGFSVKTAMESMAVIGGLIIFFNTVLAVLVEIGLPDSGLLGGVIAGVIEVTSGVNKISGSGVSVLNIGIAAFVVAFGGLSIHMQTLHFTEGTGIKAAPYLLAKILHGIIAATITMCLWILVTRIS